MNQLNPKAKESKINTKKPNFFIIGAAKSGTTSLYSYLRQHPKIFLPEEKELNFFISASENFYNSIDWYLDWFQQAQPGQVCG